MFDKKEYHLIARSVRCFKYQQTRALSTIFCKENLRLALDEIARADKILDKIDKLTTLSEQGKEKT